jgi:hypothetical protein
MADPVSISIRDLSTKAKGSVAKALETHQKTFPKPNYIFGFVPPWWIGIIIRNPLENVTLADARKLATDIHKGVGSSLPALRGSSPGAVIGPGHITCGFIAPEVAVFEE